MSLTGRFVGVQDPDAATDSVFSGLFLASIYASVVSIACLLMTPAMIGIFLAPDTSGETIDLAKWGTQLNAFMMFILAWSAILGGALRGVGDTYGAMTIFAAFWWFQFLLVLLLIRIFEFTPREVLAIHAFSSPILCLAMLARLRSGAWRKLTLVTT